MIRTIRRTIRTMLFGDPPQPAKDAIRLLLFVQVWLTIAAGFIPHPWRIFSLAPIAIVLALSVFLQIVRLMELCRWARRNADAR